MTMLPKDERRLFLLALALVAAIAAVRVAILIVSPLQLYPDEAQYWWWSRSLDWGYFSKPPLIAWIIRLTTAFGDPEWAIRLASPLLHAGTALLLFGIGRWSFDARIGFWSALAYATLPGVSYSAGLISTDVPLLFCWAAALYAFLRALDDARWRWPILCGVAFGAGLLAKYAMLYFVLGAIVAGALSPKARRIAFSGRGAAILGLGLLILSPNLIWNAAHGFPTLAHTEANADWGQANYNLANAAAFVIGQFGVFGPLTMAGYLFALWRLWRWPAAAKKQAILAAFSVPVLLLILIQAFISGANANWAAVAYIAAVPLAVAALLERWRGMALWLSLALGCAAMIALWIVLASPSVAWAAGFGNALKRQEGWRALGAAVVDRARRSHADTIVAANRSVLAELLYYARPRSAPIRAWDRNRIPRDHFQMTIPLEPGPGQVLLALRPDETARVLSTFDSHRLAVKLSTPLDRRRVRKVWLYGARGYRGPQTLR